ncbi:DUF4998 domain-containing protein [Sphingobacterium tabacisoli]|uniref:DUF4998 domain-containing protein n=1 Tax=Sphingobacterium tabacisoli TaxID=2044855 RepID=A0ABW5KX90_9SPHI|nr:DUF4998 domain-containing protein [Sphingobacterium tabacisoli]
MIDSIAQENEIDMMAKNKFKRMKHILYLIAIVFTLSIAGCDNADDLLNQYIKDGPIVYAGKITDLNIKSGHKRLGIGIYPAEDVNRAYCMLRWNTGSGAKDSLKVDYIPANYNAVYQSYFTTIEMPSIEGNVLIEAWNVDTFGNKSLLTNKGGFVYGEKYIKTLMPSIVKFTAGNKTVEFDNKIGVIDNLVSYQQTNGEFTAEEKVVKSLPLVNPQKGGKVRSKTRYLINTNDLDTLVTGNYLETWIP